MHINVTSSINMGRRSVTIFLLQMQKSNSCTVVYCGVLPLVNFRHNFVSNIIKSVHQFNVSYRLMSFKQKKREACKCKKTTLLFTPLGQIFHLFSPAIITLHFTFYHYPITVTYGHIVPVHNSDTWSTVSVKTEVELSLHKTTMIVCANWLC